MEGPYQIIHVTNTAVKGAGVPQWIHIAHTKRVKPVKEEEVFQETTNLQVPNSLRAEQVCSVDPEGEEEKRSGEEGSRSLYSPYQEEN